MSSVRSNWPGRQSRTYAPLAGAPSSWCQPWQCAPSTSARSICGDEIGPHRRRPNPGEGGRSRWHPREHRRARLRPGPEHRLDVRTIGRTARHHPAGGHGRAGVRDRTKPTPDAGRRRRCHRVPGLRSGPLDIPVRRSTSTRDDGWPEVPVARFRTHRSPSTSTPKRSM